MAVKKKAASRAKRPEKARTATRAKASSARGARTARARRPGPAARERHPLLDHLQQDFEAVRDVVSKEFERALEGARHGVERLDAGRLKSAEREVRARLKDAGQRLGEARRKVAATGERIAEDERVRAVADAGVTALHGLAGSLRVLGERMETALADLRVHATGETAERGAFVCRGCGEVVELLTREPLPACGRCGGRTFRRA